MPKKIRHNEQLNKKKIKIINYLSFLLGLSQAILIYITSSYLGAVVKTDNISIYYLVSYAIVLSSLLYLHKTIKKFGKSTVFFSTLVLKIFSLVMLSLLPPTWLSLCFMVLYLVSVNLDWVCLDIILESYSVDRKSGRIRGLYLMMLNLGFIFGPFISTQALAAFDFQFVFSLALVIDTAVLWFAVKNLKNVNHTSKANVPLPKLFKKILGRIDILRIYYIAFILEFFYAIMIIYSPIYLRGIGMSWGQIGFIFTVMLVPFVALPYPMGYLADKKLGEKELITLAIFIMCASTASIYFINSANVLLWAAILLATRIGASTVDTLRDSYFYKRIDGRDVDFIDFFRTSTPLAYVTASIFSFIFMLFFPLKLIFIILAVVIFSAFYPVFRLSDNKSEEEISIGKRMVQNLALNK